MLSFRALSLVFALLISSVGAAYGQQQQNGEITKSQAAERARNAENGRVLKIDQTKQKYRVKVLKKSGRVVSVDVDKRSGSVKPSKERTQ